MSAAYIVAAVLACAAFGCTETVVVSADGDAIGAYCEEWNGPTPVDCLRTCTDGFRVLKVAIGRGPSPQVLRCLGDGGAR